MREQPPQERIKNFNEVPYGYNEEEAVAEASRCLQCKKALCVTGCPAEIHIPSFILAIREKRFEEALSIIKKTNSLPAVCGRVCPQEDQCERFCILTKKGRAVSIGNLERFAADRGGMNPVAPKAPLGVNVAVIGAGPAGLTCAADLAGMGYRVTVFEALHKPGGVLTYGIPEFRLPKAVVMKEVEAIESLGVNIQCNYIIGAIKTIDQLREEGFKAFFISTGAGLPYFMGIDGESLNGVYSANEFLTRINLMKAYRFPDYDTPVAIGNNVAVIGGGNVAMDAARCAVRLGAGKVSVIYRRTVEDMPARIEEIHHAGEEGVEIQALTTPVRIVGDPQGFVKGLICAKNGLGKMDHTGRQSPVMIKGSEFEIPMDTVIMAIGNGSSPLLLDTIKGLVLTEQGHIQADAAGQTSVPDIFAGGDIVTGAATVIAAMGAGKKAARAMNNYLKNL